MMKRKYSNLVTYLLIAGIVAFYGGRYLYFLPKYADGESAPMFSATQLDGQAFHLADLKGQYVLIDFWGSWCGPCRAENPNLVNLYKAFHNRKFKNASGFNIVSVAIEKNANRWKSAIQRDGLEWPHHILDPTNSFKFFDSEIASQFGVKQLPTKFLLDPTGKIVGVDQSINEIKTYLNAQLN